MTNDKTMWMVRAGEAAYLFDEFKTKNIVAIGWNETRDLSKVSTPEEIKQIVKEKYPDYKLGKLNISAGQISRFRLDFKKGDNVIAYDPGERIYLFGEIVSDCEIDNLLLYYLNIQLDKPLNLYFFKSGSEGQSITFHTFPEEIGDKMHYLFYHSKYEILDGLKNKYKVVELNKVTKEPIIRGEQPEHSEDGVAVIKTVDLKNEYIDYENCLNVSEEFFEEYAEKHPEGVLRKGDILIASTGYVSMGKVDIYEGDEPAMADGHISILRVKSEYDPYFIVYYLRSHFGQIQFDKWRSGSSGQIEIQPQDLEGFLIPESSEEGIPLEKQKGIAQKITEKLNDVFELGKKAKEKWEEAKRLFEKMMLDGVENERAAKQHTLTSFTGVLN